VQPGPVDEQTPIPLDPRRLRRSLGRFATGVTIVTYLDDGVARGVTVNSFTSVSVDPPLILVSVARSARAAAGLDEKPFVVNVLSWAQLPLARQFAGQNEDAVVVPWSQHHAVPRLRGSVAWLECLPHAQVQAGDHVLVLGRVVDHRTSASEPLLFSSGQFCRLGAAVTGSVPVEQAVSSVWVPGYAAALAEEGVVVDAG
jgi:flavin reductase (DIM6/NTAB) family NADH-FMN oxidoreductase RutF